MDAESAGEPARASTDARIDEDVTLDEEIIHELEDLQIATLIQEGLDNRVLVGGHRTRRGQQ